MMPTITIGIDPGLQGAISLLVDDGESLVYDLPTIGDKSLEWIDGGALQSLILQHPGKRWAYVERVSAMPKQGVSSSFKFGVGFGAVLGVLQALQIPIEFVTPATWKRAMHVSDEKQASLDKARLLFPACDLRLKKHHGRAEALLIAQWARTHRPRTLPLALR